MTAAAARRNRPARRAHPATVHLAADEAAYVTGQHFVLDGGVSTRGPFA